MVLGAIRSPESMSDGSVIVSVICISTKGDISSLPRKTSEMRNMDHVTHSVCGSVDPVNTSPVVVDQVCVLLLDPYRQGDIVYHARALCACVVGTRSSQESVSDVLVLSMAVMDQVAIWIECSRSPDSVWSVRLMALESTNDRPRPVDTITSPVIISHLSAKMSDPDAVRGSVIGDDLAHESITSVSDPSVVISTNSSVPSI